MAQHTLIQMVPTRQCELPGSSREGLEIRLLVFFALCAVNFVANFLFFSDFGFYEDDYLVTIPAFTWSGHDLVSHVISSLLTWPQGRPVLGMLQSSLSFFISRSETIWPFYGFAFVFTSCVAMALFGFLRRIANAPGAFLAAVFYLLFPADTSKQIFMHQLAFGFSVLLTIAAFTFFLKGKPLIAYCFGAMMLLNYEPYFLLLFFLPLLRPVREWKAVASAMLRNAGILAVILISVLFIRKCVGDSRASDVLGNSFSGYLLKAAEAPWIGVYTAFLLCVTRAIEAVLYATQTQKLLSIFSAGIIAAVSFVLVRMRADNQQIRQEPNLDDSASYQFQLIVTGLAMFVFAYVYRFYPDYFPPIVNIGRLSALHAVGLIGLCIAAASVINMAFQSRRWLGIFFIAISVVYYGLLVAFALEVQETQYVRNWNQQKLFMESIVNQIGDLQENDVIVVNIESGAGYPDPRPYTEGFPPFWMVNYPCNIFPKLLATPRNWHRQPNLHGFWNAAHMERTPSGLFVGTPPWWPRLMQPVISSGKFLLFEWSGGTLKRSSSPIQFEGEKYFPREASPSSFQRFPTSKLYDILFNTNQRALWPVFLNSRNYPS